MMKAHKEMVKYLQIYEEIDERVPKKIHLILSNEESKGKKAKEGLRLPSIELKNAAGSQENPITPKSSANTIKRKNILSKKHSKSKSEANVEIGGEKS